MQMTTLLLSRHVLSCRPFPSSRTRHLSKYATKTIQTPVAIVGGGPSGLLLSNLLSSYQVPSVLIEGQSVKERCKHPQAHFLNTRSMEILRQLPRVYRRVQDQMTPVEHWEHFQFGYDMLPETALARVQHPVGRPLLANVDANGTLVEEGTTNDPVASTARPLSACSVGHLAQHTFCKILYEAAQEEALPDTQLHYSTRVTKLNNTTNAGFSIQTNTGLTVQAPVCIAADGAHSFCRKEWNINQVGQVGIQHLLNIHVKTCPEWARSYLHNQGRNFAMLYSTFHPNVVAMIVTHSIGEYVFQVPFFPPYQSLDDYTPQKVEQMIYDAMGIGSSDTIHKNNALMEVVSVKAWTMSSLIAERYFHPTGSGGVGYLVGDAAHVFPPAGGLGMNTGMQDVYSLAWKLAWAFHQGHLSQENTFSDDAQTILRGIGTAYEDERQPVAQSNAALSVRNYNRVLEITKACYMYDQHPALLIQALEASSALVPFDGRREVFQRLYTTATWTLSSLRDPHHPYTKHLRQNIRRVLARGGGLPLLFPQAELGFGYDDEGTNSHDRPRDEDTMGFTPTVRVGYLFPHVEATIVSPQAADLMDTFPALKLLDHISSEGAAASISLSDLPAQVSRDMKPCFVLLLVCNASDAPDARATVYLKAAQILPKLLGMSIEVVQVLTPSSSPPNAALLSQHLVLQEVPHSVDGSFLDQYEDSVWLIRPDGHVAGEARIVWTETASQLQEVLLQFARQALLGRSSQS